MEIKLQNGKVLNCEPKGDEFQVEVDNQTLLKCLIENAWFFYHHRERIYADSKLFLAKVPIRVHDGGWAFVLENPSAEEMEIVPNPEGATVIGESYMATLGGLLECWENNSLMVVPDNKYAEEEGCVYGLVYQMSKKPYFLYAIMPDSKARLLDSLSCYEYMPKEKMCHQKYHVARERSKSLTLMQVKELLAKETGTDHLNKDALECEQLKFQKRALNRKLAMLKRVIERQHDKNLEQMKELCYHNREKIRHVYEKCIAIKAKQDAEMERINAELCKLRKELKRTGDVDVQRKYQQLKQEKKDLECSPFNCDMNRESFLRGVNPIKAMKYADEFEAKLKAKENNK